MEDFDEIIFWFSVFFYELKVRFCSLCGEDLSWNVKVEGYRQAGYVWNTGYDIIQYSIFSLKYGVKSASQILKWLRKECFKKTWWIRPQALGPILFPLSLNYDVKHIHFQMLQHNHRAHYQTIGVLFPKRKLIAIYKTNSIFF